MSNRETTFKTVSYKEYSHIRSICDDRFESKRDQHMYTLYKHRPPKGQVSLLKSKYLQSVDVKITYVWLRQMFHESTSTLKNIQMKFSLEYY